MKTRLAITGGIACGKSVVGTLLARRGIPVRDADDLAHEALERDRAVRAAVEEEFGAGILGEGGAVDRHRLGAIVFADAAARSRLEAILHPPVLRRLHEWVAGQLAANDLVVGIVPLLYETGEDVHWDVVICVTTTVGIQKARLAARGHSESDAAIRTAAQMRTGDKMKKADFVLHNSGTLAMLEDQVDRVLHRIRQERV